MEFPADGDRRWITATTKPQNTPRPATFHVFSADGEAHSFPADQRTQERWESIRQMILGKLAEVAERMPRREPSAAPDPQRLLLFPDPDLFDAVGWERHLDWLNAEPEFQGRADAIEDAQTHLAALKDWAAARAIEDAPERPAGAP